MYLDRLEIIGFKSFAQKTTVIFPKPKNNNFGITAVVGPNGSGKSNIVDAIAWGLGEQSLKTLRSKNFENIFSETATGKNREAKVDLFFSNEKGEPEFEISRHLFRTGENEYLINSDKVKLGDVIFLLAQHNFGQKSYSFVNQGMTDAILKSSSEERQVFFNEATGIKQYMIKRNEAIRKIVKSQKNLDNALIALAELTPHLNSLKRQMNKLQKRQILEKELRSLQKTYYGEIWQELNAQIISKKQGLEKKTSFKKEIENNLSGFKAKIEEFGKEEIDKNYFNKQEKYQELLEIKNDYFKKQTFLEFEIKQVQKRGKGDEQIEITAETKKILGGLKEMKDFVLKLKEEKDILKIKELVQAISLKLEDLINCFKENKENFSGDLENKTKECEEIKTKIESLSEEIKKINQELSQFLSEEKAKRGKILEEQKEIEKYQNQLNIIDNEINEIKIETARIETRKDDLEKEIIEETGSLEILKEKEADELRPNREKLDQIKKMKHQLEMIGGIDPEVEKEHKIALERFNFLSSQTEDLKESIKSLKEIIYKLEEKIKIQFKENFTKINKEFDRFFKILFGGGGAKIKLEEISKNLEKEITSQQEAIEEVEETKLIEQKEYDIEILAEPPGKKIKNIEMLSGGEKALTSLGLICAIISINKPPFVILDEADAALDEKNSDRFAKIIKELVQRTQFILISHNPVVMEIADVLYGATMERGGSTKLISMKLE